MALTELALNGSIEELPSSLFHNSGDSRIGCDGKMLGRRCSARVLVTLPRTTKETHPFEYNSGPGIWF